MTSETGTVPSLAGKTVLVTGATSGIGLATAEALAETGATLLVVGRDPSRTAEAADRLRAAPGRPAVETFLADLSSLAEVRRLAAEVKARHPRLHALVNNAGAMFDPRRESADGIEMTWALNHLAYFLLTNLLLDPLKAGAPSRVVNVASEAHRMVRGIDFQDVEGKARYKAFRAYSQSKLANVLFTAELARRLEGTGVSANALHPGFVSTRFFQKSGRIYTLFKLAAKVASIDPGAGAKTSVYLAGSPDVAGVTGRYFAKSREATPSRAARDPGAARRLWELSEATTGTAAPA